MVANWWLYGISGLKLHPLLISNQLKWQRLEGPNAVLLEMYSLPLLFLVSVVACAERHPRAHFTRYPNEDIWFTVLPPH